MKDIDTEQPAEYDDNVENDPDYLVFKSQNRYSRDHGYPTEAMMERIRHEIPQEVEGFDWSETVSQFADLTPEKLDAMYASVHPKDVPPLLVPRGVVGNENVEEDLYAFMRHQITEGPEITVSRPSRHPSNFKLTCDLEPEDIVHAERSCRLSDEAWEELKSSLPQDSIVPDPKGHDWFSGRS